MNVPIPFDGWNTDPLTVFSVIPSGTAIAQLDFDGTEPSVGGNAGFQWLHSAQSRPFAPLVEGSFGAGEYLVMYDNIVEIVGTDSDPFLTLDTVYQPGVWVDADGALLRMLDQSSTPGHEHVYSCDVHLAKDNGGGSPLAGTDIIKPMKFIATRIDPRGFDTFGGTNGDDVDGRAPDLGAFPPATNWSVLNGAMEIQNNRAVMDTGASTDPALAVIDTGDADTAWGAFIHPSSTDDFAIVGRVQDLDNYWQLKIEDADTADPVLILNEVISDVETLRESIVMIGRGPLDTTDYQALRLTFNGNDMLGVALLKELPFDYEPKNISKNDVIWFIRHTSSSYNTETRFGIQLPQANAQVTSAFGTFFDALHLAHIDP